MAKNFCTRSRIIRTAVVATLFSFFSLIAQVAFADLHTWTNMTTLPAGQYQGAAVSGDGTIMVASPRNNFFYHSSDSGATWTRTSGTASGVYFFAMSVDGSKIFAGGKEGGYNYTSTDSGATWTSRTPGVVPSGRPCMSDDGQIIMLTPANGTPRLSQDGGATWADVSGLSSANYIGCAMSQDGSTRYAIRGNASTFYRSTDNGVTWNTTTLPHPSWSDVATSADGSVVFVSTGPSRKVYKSTNSGQSFTLVATPALTSPGFLAISGDASDIVIFDDQAELKISTDGGNTWTSETSPGSKRWFAGDISDDGSKIVAPVATNSNYVYKSGIIAPTSLTSFSGSTSPMLYRTIYSISASTNYDGKVTFYANRKRIGGCVSIPTVSLLSSCNYKPTVKGAVTISVKIVPTNVANTPLTVELFRTKIIHRNTVR